MSVCRDEVVMALETLLQIASFQDYCPNGLQVEGSTTISKLATAVTASMSAIQAAQEWCADTLLVHHGYFWRGESATLVGMKKRRVAQLISGDMNLLAYHLPLDYHLELGNNTALGQELARCLPEFELTMGHADQPIWQGSFAAPCDPATFLEGVARAVSRAPLWIDAGGNSITRFGWCTGGAQDLIDAAAQMNLDAFISGEISERTTHSAREQGIHFFAAGHHATERYGVQRLGAWLSSRFAIEHRFFDLDNPA